MANYAPHIVHETKLYFAPVDPDHEVSTIRVVLGEFAGRPRADEIMEKLQEDLEIQLRPATANEVLLHEEQREELDEEE